MKILVSPDSFKGSLTAMDAAQAMEKGIFSIKVIWESMKI